MEVTSVAVSARELQSLSDHALAFANRDYILCMSADSLRQWKEAATSLLCKITSAECPEAGGMDLFWRDAAVRDLTKRLSDVDYWIESMQKNEPDLG